jgi:hypothetical protein
METDDQAGLDDVVVQQTTCETAEEFLMRLNPQDSFWQPDPTAWIFRGHARAEWPLLSTAHRVPVEELERWGLLGEDAADFDESWTRQVAENTLWHHFRRALDEAGLEIPTKAVEISHPMGVLHMHEVTPEGIPLLALAQHFGLPTSLLDWTRIAAKGAYFAASDLEVDSRDGRLAVWALKKEALDAGASAERPFMRVVTAPLASNPNLYAQSGIFTQSRAGNDTAVDDYVCERYSNFPPEVSEIPSPWMHKITLPRSCAPRLLQLLSYLGVHGSSMFPGYAGVVRRLREEAVWRKKREPIDTE